MEILYIQKEANIYNVYFRVTNIYGELDYQGAYSYRSYRKAREKYNKLVRRYHRDSVNNPDLPYKVVGNRVVMK